MGLAGWHQGGGRAALVQAGSGSGGLGENVSPHLLGLQELPAFLGACPLAPSAKHTTQPLPPPLHLLSLRPPCLLFVRTRDCAPVEPTWLIQANHPISRPVNVIASAMSLLLCRTACSQAPGLGCECVWGAFSCPPQLGVVKWYFQQIYKKIVILLQKQDLELEWQN